MRTLAPALALLAIAAILCGCGSSSDETTGEATTANPPASTSTSPQGAPAGSAVTVCKGSSSSSEDEARVTGVSCGAGRQVVAGWFKDSDCSGPPGASRTSCKLGAYTCLGTTTDRGIAVTCSAPGRSIAFTARPD